MTTKFIDSSNGKRMVIDKDQEELKEVIEAFFEDDPLLEEHYISLGKLINEHYKLKAGPYWDKIRKLKQQIYMMRGYIQDAVKAGKQLPFLRKKPLISQIIEYLKKPLSFDEIKEIVEKLAIKPIELVRKNEQIWKDNYKGKEMTDVEIIKIMERNQKLIERPIVINEKHGIIGRPPEKVLSLFAQEGIWSSSNFPSFAQTKIK